MQLTRRYAAAVAAVTGAGLIAAGTDIARPDDLQYRATQLTAGLADDLADPSSFDFSAGWSDVFGDSLKNIGTIAEQVIGNGAPVATQFLANQIDYGQALFGGLQGAVTGTLAWFFDDQPGNNIGYFVDQITDLVQQGEFIQAGDALNAGIMSLLFSAALPLAPISMIPGEIAQNFSNVVDVVVGQAALPLIANLVGAPLLAVNQALFDSLQTISDAHDPLDVLGAVLNTPAALTGAFLNGWEKTVEGLPPALTPGLLTPLLPDGEGTGPLAFLLVGLPQAIAGALGADASEGPLAETSTLGDLLNVDPTMLVESLF